MLNINDISNIIKAANKIYFIVNHQHIYELTDDRIRYVFSAHPGSKVIFLGKIDRINTFYYLSNGQVFSYHADSGITPLSSPPTKGEVTAIRVNESGLFFVKKINTHSPNHCYFYHPYTNQFILLNGEKQKKELRPLANDKLNTWCFRSKKNVFLIRLNDDASLDTLLNYPLEKLLYKESKPDHGEIIDGQIWLFSRHFAELLQVKPQFFHSFLNEDNQASVRDILQVNDSILLMASYKGLKQLDILKGEIEPVFDSTLDFKYYAYGMLTYKENIYIGVHGYFLLRINWNTKKEQIISYDKEKNLAATDALIPFVDQKGKIWLGRQQGLGYIGDDEQLHRLQFSKPSNLNKAQINSLTQEENSHRFWLATDIGLYLFDPSSNAIVDSIMAFVGKNIIDIKENNGAMWVLPKGEHPYIWHKDTKHIDTIPLFNPEWQNNFHTVIRDTLNYYWLPSDNGLFRYDLINKKAERFTLEENDLPSNEFNKLAWEKLADGRIAFGGIKGMVLFDPRNFDKKNRESNAFPLQIIDLKMRADGVEKKYPFQEYLSAPTLLQFPANFEQIIVRFNVLNPLPDDVRYFFRLDAKSANAEWTEVNDPQLIFEQLPYGKHKLEIAIRDRLNDQFIDQTQLEFAIAYPWYLQFWALLGFFLLLILAIQQTIKYRIRRVEMENLRLEQVIQERTQEIKRQNIELASVNAAKNKLFAIIGHELRAPLIGVIGLSKKAAYVLKNGKMESLEKMSRQIDRYANDTQTMLQNLLNWGQIMVEEPQSQVEPIQLEELVNEIITQGADLAQPKGIGVVNEIPANIIIHFDEEALKIILRNLTINAIKFSIPQSTIRITYDLLERNLSQICIYDQGKGMPKEILENWNSPDFSRSTTGTAGEKGLGLGLKLCQSVAEQNGSRLFFELPETGGTKAILEFETV